MLRIPFWPALLCATAMLQTLLLSLVFPLSQLFSELPLLYIDAPVHWYRLVTAVNLAEQGNLIGYDPFFAAGTRVGIVANPAGKVAAIAAVLAQGFASEAVVWKLYSFIASIVAALCVPIALRMLGAGRVAIIAGTILGLMLWWVSMFRWFHTAGLVSFVLVAYLGVVYMAGIVRYLSGSGGAIAIAALGLGGALFMLLHPLFPVPIMVATVIFLMVSWRELRWHRLLPILLVVPALSLLPNLPHLWLVFNSPDPPVSVTAHQAIVDANLLWKELLGLWQGDAHGSKVYALIALAAGCALMLATPGRERRLVFVTGLSGVVLILFAALGGGLGPIAFWTQPNRFAPVGYLWLCLPASIGIAHLIGLASIRQRDWRGITASAGVALIALLSLVNLNEVRRELSHADTGHYGATPPRVQPLGDYSKTALLWLEQHTTQSARVLFETSNGRIHDGGHMAPYYAYTAQREFIGGAYPFSHFAGFWDGYLFGQPVTELETAEFEQYANLYNLGWIIVFSDDSKGVFDRMPGVSPIAEYEAMKLYRINREHSYFLEGQGRVALRDHNRLELENLKGDAVIIKYHHLSGIDSTPPATIESVSFLDDPGTFIKIVNPPEKLSLSFH